MRRSVRGKSITDRPASGTPHHLAMELFKLQTKTDLKHIPYRGTAGATQDLTGGHVTAGFQVVHVALPLVNTGQLRFLGVASKERVAGRARRADARFRRREGFRRSDLVRRAGAGRNAAGYSRALQHDAE